MKWTALIKLMILCLVVLGMSIFSNDLLRGMNKAEIGKKKPAQPAQVQAYDHSAYSQLWGIPPI